MRSCSDGGVLFLLHSSVIGCNIEATPMRDENGLSLLYYSAPWILELINLITC
jgi:hypothetical protein